MTEVVCNCLIDLEDSVLTVKKAIPVDFCAELLRATKGVDGDKNLDEEQARTTSRSTPSICSSHTCTPKTQMQTSGQ